MQLKGKMRIFGEEKQREQLAQGLGWFSLGLGLAEIFAPRTVSRAIGVPAKPRLMAFLGLRQMACGIGILTQPETKFWLQTRVNGNAMDLGLLSAATLSKKSNNNRIAWATAALAAITALDVLAAQAFEEGAGLPTTLHYRKTFIVNRRPEELYKLWRDFEGLPRFMSHLISVKNTGERRSHWIAKGPANTTVEWDAEISEDRPHELIAWHSLGNAELDHAGVVRFKPVSDGRRTLMRVEMDYRPLGGRIGATLVNLFGESPEKQIGADLLRFRHMAEKETAAVV